jgi:hypothetical protein
MRKRLEQIEDKFRPDDNKSGVVFLPLDGETREQMDSRIERWYAGEKVEGQDRLYTGREPLVMRVGYVKSVCNDAI